MDVRPGCSDAAGATLYLPVFLVVNFCNGKSEKYLYDLVGV